MILPNVESVLIEETKVVDYLLNPAHPDNGGKAAFFTRWGFVRSDWTTLATPVREMVSRTNASDRIQSPFGEKYVVDGPLNAPNGTTPPIRTVWIVDRASTVPRLVTAYPKT